MNNNTLKEQLAKLSDKDRKEFFIDCMNTYTDDFTILFREWLYSFDIADLEANFSQTKGGQSEKDKA